MDAKALTERIEEISRNLGLSESIRARLVSAAESFAAQAAGVDSHLAKEVTRLRTQVDEARAERDRMAAAQREIMQLLGSPSAERSAERIVHDLRNLLNDLVLRKAVDLKLKQGAKPQDVEARKTVEAGEPKILN